MLECVGSDLEELGMTIDRIDPARTALVLFDFLNGHIKSGDAATQARYAPVLVNTRRLLEKARDQAMMIAYANAAHRPDNATSGVTVRDTDNRLQPMAGAEARRFAPAIHANTWEAQVVDELAPRDSDYIVPKYRWSAFFQTYLDLALRSRRVDTIVLCGGSTDVGIASTTYAARDLDYSVVVVRDACTSPEQDNHAQFMGRVFPRMARVRDTDAVLAMIGGTDA
jgi:ureidoacrylate peracid hydrolase